MATFPVIFRNPSDIIRHMEPVQFGHPFPPGKLYKHEQLILKDQNGGLLPLCARVLSLWPDGSIRWLLLQSQVSLSARASKQLELFYSDTSPAVAYPSLQVSHTEQQIVINTGVGEFKLDKHQWLPFKTLNCENQSLELDDNSGLHLSLRQGDSVSAVVDSITVSDDSTPLCASIITKGHFSESPLLFSSRINFFAGHQFIRGELSLHNPQAAHHPGGLWDLGDGGSIQFNNLSIELSPSTHKWQGAIKPNQATDWIDSKKKRLSLFQASSGGENWASPNHQNQHREVTLPFRGYEVTANEYTDRGLRASPYGSIHSEKAAITAHIEKFWQNFPKALEIDNKKLKLHLFPPNCVEPHELQGGEIKTHRFTIDTSTNINAIDWTDEPLEIAIPRATYQDSGYIKKADDRTRTNIDQLIQVGLDKRTGFLAKREIIDEYGWRNFGDIFADHETLYQPSGEVPLISHYNNQYDAVYGFARQFIETGDQRWFTLMDDLALHVADIDLYHTSGDRDEYNNGLFWHTDHYLPAHTGTHRSFTRHNSTSSTGGTGGGPGAEHCYTTGLKLHYYITGHQTSRAAVLSLAQWIDNSHEGSPTLLGQLLSIAKHELKQLKQLASGISPSPYRYPLSRGTGNYIVALLDAYEVSGDSYFLEKAETVLVNTLHPNDNITDRELNNIESNWSYTILLQAIIRFIEVKTILGDKDDYYHHASQSLLHYAKWMADNERSYLSDPDALEYPNDTWVAQEIRKVHILGAAAHLAPPSEARHLLAKGLSFYEYLTQNLHSSNTCHYSRILVILMQNYGVEALFNTPLISHPEQPQQPEIPPQPTVTYASVIRRCGQKLLYGMKKFNLKKEANWIKSRIQA